MKVFLFCLSLFFTNVLVADPSFIESNISTSKTSDDLNLRKTYLSFMNNRRDLFWNFKGEKESDIDYGASVKRVEGDLDSSLYLNQANLKLGRKWDFNNYSLIEVGVSELEFQTEKSSLANYHFSQMYQRENLNLSLDFLHDFYFREEGISAPLTRKLTFTKTILSLLLKPKSYMRIPIRYSNASISDDNSYTHSSFDLVFGKSYPAWVWAGYGVENLVFKESRNGYWSPEKFSAHGPRLEMAIPVNDAWAFKCNYNYNTIKEGSFPAGKSSYFVLGFDWGDRNETLVGLSYNRIESAQNGNEWWSEEIKLSLQHSFDNL